MKLIFTEPVSSIFILAFCRSHSELHGYVSCLQEISGRLMLTYQLALFWLVLCVTQFYIFHSSQHSVLSRNWVVVVLVTLSEVLTSPVSLLGFCIAVSFFAQTTLMLTKVYLQGFSGFVRDSTMHTGYAEGLTVLLLSGIILILFILINSNFISNHFSSKWPAGSQFHSTSIPDQHHSIHCNIICTSVDV